MDIILMIIYGTIVLAVLVFVHEAGHYLSARAFGVRVTEFMVGLPGPSVGVTWKGTRFGVTCIPLGGYAKICGMEPGEMHPHLEEALAYVYRNGTVVMEEVAQALGISDDEAYEVLEELTEWGSISAPTKKDAVNTYRAMAVKGKHGLGEAREVADAHALYESEYNQQYRSKPFWKRTVMLLAGVIMNLLFAILLFVLVYSVIGLDVTNPQTGVVQHVTADPGRAIMFGFQQIGQVVSAVAGLFNPATAAKTVEGSASIMGIAVISKEYADLGFSYFLWFMGMISISIGIMNLLPIPPLDGGRFVVEIFQKVSRKLVSVKVMNYISIAGVLLFAGFFLLMLNQDIQHFVFGNWGG